jgi:hypothetical protein
MDICRVSAVVPLPTSAWGTGGFRHGQRYPHATGGWITGVRARFAGSPLASHQTPPVGPPTFTMT